MSQKLYGWGLPVDVSTSGWEIDRLIYILHVFMAVLFVGWVVFLIYTLFRFRQRPGENRSTASGHFKLPTYLEVGVALFEVLLLTAFAFPIWNQTHVKMPSPESSLQVRVVAEQFAWNIHYPGKDGLYGKTDPKLVNQQNPLGLVSGDPSAADDVVTLNQFHIPVGKPVIVELSSKDVIHSFALPVMRIKQDAIPGQKVKIWFEAKRTGDFEIACAQLCGLGHYRMRGFFVVDSPDAFAKWFDEQAAAGKSS
ncbi:MAG: cytochrome c oxidase subunit II [Candidatus Omnitrophica bacterium]|nr:cytochrome c oxidase subunit II [Candidatus Omnitrophota bacterium]